MKVELIYRLVGFRIAIYREKLDMTQESLAVLVGFDRTSIANIENGNQRIMLHDIESFAKALEVAPKLILKGCWEDL